MRNKLIFLCLIGWMLSLVPLTAAAQELAPGQRGTISVSLVAPDSEQPMAGAELAVYSVASVGQDSGGNLIYSLREAFRESGISLDDPDLASKLDAYVSEHDIPSQQIVTDENGSAICGNLPLGLYLVKQTGAVEGFAPCASFLVTIPYKTENGLLYDVDASPKTDVVRLVSITIKKVWNTGKSTTIPGSVTIQLLRDGKVVETATLNKQNDWQITYPNLPESDAYSVKEVNVPKGYTATYAQKGYVFTVTNTPSLAQTGQLIWPIPVLAAAGLFFLLMGFAILRKPEKSDA